MNSKCSIKGAQLKPKNNFAKKTDFFLLPLSKFSENRAALHSKWMKMPNKYEIPNAKDAKKCSFVSILWYRAWFISENRIK